MLQNKIIKPNEDLRGRSLVNCAIPKMDSLELAEGAVFYNCYREPQEYPKSAIVVGTYSILDVYSDIREFEGGAGDYTFQSFNIDLSGYGEKFFLFEKTWFTDCRFYGSIRGEYSDFNFCTFTNCTFDNLDEDVSYSFDSCIFKGSFKFDSRTAETLTFNTCTFDVDSLDILPPSEDLEFLGCISRIAFPEGDSVYTGNSLVLADNVSIVEQSGMYPKTVGFYGSFDWTVRNADLRCLDLALSHRHSRFRGADFQGSVFGALPHSTDTSIHGSYIRLSEWAAYRVMYDQDYKAPPIFYKVNFADTLIDQLYIQNRRYYPSLFDVLKQEKIPVFEQCDFSRSTLGFIATFTGARDLSDSSGEKDPKGITFRDCNFENAVSYYREKFIARRGGYYIGDNSTNEGLDLSGRKLLGQYRNVTLRNTNLSDCVWYNKMFIWNCDFGNCDFSGLRLAKYTQLDPAKYDFITHKTNLTGCIFKDLPRGFSIYLSPLCSTDGATFDSNIEWSTDKDGFRLGIVV